MKAVKIIAFVIAAILILFGVIFILGAFSPQGQTSWIITGIVLLISSFALIFLATRIKTATGEAGAAQNVTYKIDLPGSVNMDTIKCKSCGGTLTSNDIKMVAGAPVVTCPYCHTSYQLTEEPKW
jgi:Na+/melibiose symporter-like transporter